MCDTWIQFLADIGASTIGVLIAVGILLIIAKGHRAWTSSES